MSITNKNTGTITSTQTVEIDSNGLASVLFNVTGTWTGTLNVEGQIYPGSNWIALKVFNETLADGILYSNITTNSRFSLNASGYTTVRVFGNTVASGTATIEIASSEGISPVQAISTVSGTVASTQSGTWNINNISGTVSLPTGASTSALQTTGNSSLSSIDTKTPALGQTTMANSSPVAIASNQSAIPASQSGTWNITNVSGTVSLPTGASTAAKQPALGTAGSASADVITVQGIASMTALKVDGSGATQPISGTVSATQSGTWTVQPGNTANTTAWKVDGSAVTQPISGTVTANAGTNLNTSLLALESGGNLASTKTNTDNLNLAQASTTSGQKGNLILGAVTTAAPTYTTAQSNPLSLTTAGAVRTDSSGTTQPVSGTVAATQSGTWTVQPGNTANTTAWKVDGSAVTQPVSGTVTANQGGTWNITNISGTVSLPTGAATETSLAKLTQTQGSSTSGQSGPLIQGAVTTAAPTYSNAQTSPLSLTTGGLLRIDTSANTSVTPGTGATNLGKAEDAAHTTGDVGIFSLGVRNDANATFTSTDLDYSPIATDLAGRLKVVPESSVKATYGTSIVNLATAASATDVFTLTGSASKTIKIIEIGLSGSTAAANNLSISLIKRSAANTAGTSTTPTVVPFDSTNAAATGVVRAYTANPSALGAAVGTIKSYKILIDSTTINSTCLITQDGATPSQPIVLRGTSELLAINFNATTVITPVFCLYITWTEE